MAHLMARRLEPTLYCSTMMAMHSLQKQWPQVSTAHWRRELDEAIRTEEDATSDGKHILWQSDKTLKEKERTSHQLKVSLKSSRQSHMNTISETFKIYHHTHLLSEGPGADGTWLWVQPPGWLVLRLEQKDLIYLDWDQNTQFEIKSLKEVGNNLCFVATIKDKLPSPDSWGTETGRASSGVETWPPPGRSEASLCSAPPAGEATRGRGQECNKNS